jgi:hypothetical protein
MRRHRFPMSLLLSPLTLLQARETSRYHLLFLMSISYTVISIQNLVQFDQDYVLDVHDSRLYPFDGYDLTSSIGISSSNSTLAITKLAAIYETSSFEIATADKASYAFSADGMTEMPVRFVNIKVKRPSSVRTFTLFLFSVGWMLTHICLGNFWLALRRSDNKSMRMHIFAGFAIVITLPQIRNSMVDAPGFDGGSWFAIHLECILIQRI